MGHQLWTSPVTGYRRKGTRLAELRSLLGAGITARAILEPLQSSPADASAEEMAQILRKRDFDLAGVQTVRHGPVVGFVTRESLRGGVVTDHVRSITAEHLISDATPLANLLSVLRAREYAFVLVGPEVRGIVTRADLSKPPVRVYLFGLISLLEMHLGFWVRVAYGDESWQEKLKQERMDAAKKRRADRHKRHQDVSLLECLQFCDKRDLLLARDELRGRLGLESKKQAGSRLKRAEDLRNRLAHSEQDLVQGSSWQELIDLVEWMEALVHRSDEAVEQEGASSAARRDEDGLWASV